MWAEVGLANEVSRFYPTQPTVDSVLCWLLRARCLPVWNQALAHGIKWGICMCLRSAVYRKVSVTWAFKECFLQSRGGDGFHAQGPLDMYNKPSNILNLKISLLQVDWISSPTHGCQIKGLEGVCSPPLPRSIGFPKVCSKCKPRRKNVKE